MTLAQLHYLQVEMLPKSRQTAMPAANDFGSLLALKPRGIPNITRAAG